MGGYKSRLAVNSGFGHLGGNYLSHFDDLRVVHQLGYCNLCVCVCVSNDAGSVGTVGTYGTGNPV